MYLALRNRNRYIYIYTLLNFGVTLCVNCIAIAHRYKESNFLYIDAIAMHGHTCKCFYRLSSIFRYFSIE